MIKNFTIALAAVILTICGVSFAQQFGPPIFTPKLTINPGPLAVTGTATVNGSAVCTADGTNCPSSTPSQTTQGLAITTATGCTAAHQVVMGFARVLNIVSVRILASSNCTGNATSWSSTVGIVPAAYRPDNETCTYVTALDNGNHVQAQVCFTTAGSVVYKRCSLVGTASGDCSSGLWTAAGNRNIQGNNHTFTYNIDSYVAGSGGGG